MFSPIVNTPVTTPPAPNLGAAKQLTSVINNKDGTYTVTYSIVITNLGTIAVANVQVTDSLAMFNTSPSVLVAASVTASGLTANASYNGVGGINLLAGTETLAVGGSATMTVTATVRPGNNLEGPYNNQAIVKTGTTILDYTARQLTQPAPACSVGHDRGLSQDDPGVRASVRH